MPDQMYFDLREQLNQYSVGFPSTESGVEMEILKKLFSPDEAELYLKLSLIPETPESVAGRTGGDADEMSGRLERMVDKGLIFRLKKGDTVRYGASPFVVGSYEYQLNRMDRDFAELFDRYFVEAFGKQGIGEAPPLRTIPVNKAIDHAWNVAPYEDVREIVTSKSKIAVADCICRVQQGLIDAGCNNPSEVCFQFGSHADFYVSKGMARYIEQDEALRIIDSCDEAGLVPQPFVSQDAGGMCNCCGDCCGILRSVKLHPKPAERVLTNYFAEVEADSCSGCETCVDRCQMDAVTLTDAGTAFVDRDRCIGCGLCVTTCPEEAMTLRQKPESERREPPATAKEYMMQLAQARGTSLVPLSISKSAGS
jgi:NAD-dependent dihydropyrimidine dehydrogenase PreA subunit